MKMPHDKSRRRIAYQEMGCSQAAAQRGVRGDPERVWGEVGGHRQAWLWPERSTQAAELLLHGQGLGGCHGCPGNGRHGLASGVFDGRRILLGGSSVYSPSHRWDRPLVPGRQLQLEGHIKARSSSHFLDDLIRLVAINL